MSDLLEDTPTKLLKSLLSQLHEREMALPDFQRDFVWDPSATQELIISIANNYPAGSLLAIKNTHSYFAAREAEGAPALKNHKPTYLILDGQQRLTSLYQAFYGVGEYRYFVDLKSILNGKDVDDEDVIFHVKANAKRGWHAGTLKKYSTIEGQAADLVMPLSVLFGTKNGFQGWTRVIERNPLNASRREEIENELDVVKKKLIDIIDDYKFPVVLLSDKTPAAAVCTIFETLNRTGVKLSVFDLLAARFWPQNVKLRDLWDTAQENDPIIEDFEIDPYYILQSIALMRPNVAASCKRKDVLDLDSKYVAQVWGKAIKGLVDALTILRDDCGVLIPKWLPYNTMIVPFAAILAKYPVDKGLKAGDIRQKLVRWFWCSVFGQTYENAPNSQASKDYVEVGIWIKDGTVPKDIASFKLDADMLFEVTPKQRAIYRGVVTLILSRGTRDFHALKLLNRALIEKNYVDDHHIFPDAYLRDQGVKDTKRRDCILNRTLIDRETNQSLRKRDPKDYFGEMKKKLGDGKFNQLMKSHMLPPEKSSVLLTNDYDGFLEWRRDQIGSAIKEVTSGS